MLTVDDVLRGTPEERPRRASSSSTKGDAIGTLTGLGTAGASKPTLVTLTVDAALAEWIDTAQAALDRDGQVSWDDSRHLAEVVAVKLWNEISAGLLALPDGPVDEDEPPAVTVADIRASVEAKGGEVGTITGPAILGTTDSVNAGPARGRLTG